MDLGERAISYANRGWPVFPLVAGTKVPATQRGFKDATTDIATIEKWWGHRPDSNIGLATGVVFDVMDVDSPYADERLTLGLTRGALACATPSGGFHVYYKPGRPNRVRFMPGADWRGPGGYVVAPHSWSSERGKPWRWIMEGEVQEVPSWLDSALEVPTKLRLTKSPIIKSDRYMDAKVQRAVARILSAPQGTRNHTLSRQAWSLTEHVANGDLDWDEVCDRLGNAALEAGLGYGEILKTLQSAERGSPWL